MIPSDTDPNRRASESARSIRFGARTLLICSSVALFLAMLGWCGLLWPSSRWITAYAFVLTLTLFFSPALAALALIDIRRDGWSWSRSLAFVCSGIAVALTAAAIYHIIHR